MCGRYGLYKVSEVQKRFKTFSPNFKVTDSYNCLPGQMLPVVFQADHGRVQELMHWGIQPQWMLNKHSRIPPPINSRDDQLFVKPMWKGIVTHHRCIVPMRGWFEWRDNGAKRKSKYYMSPKNGELLAAAGVYAVAKDEHGNELYSYAIVTTSANADTSPVHDRAPDILDDHEIKIWLDQTVQDRSAIEACLHEYDIGKLNVTEVSNDPDVVRINDEHLIYPINGQ